jgi:hypothetical protein
MASAYAHDTGLIHDLNTHGEVVQSTLLFIACLNLGLVR